MGGVRPVRRPVIVVLPRWYHTRRGSTSKPRYFAMKYCTVLVGAGFG